MAANLMCKGNNPKPLFLKSPARQLCCCSSGHVTDKEVPNAVGWGVFQYLELE